MNQVDKLAKIIWDYHKMNNRLKKADCLLVLGSNDIRVAEWGAKLFLKGYAPYIIFSGGTGVLTKNIYNKPEAEAFAEIAIRKGVPKDKILIENKSGNTGENIEFTQKLLEEKNLIFNSFILVQKPYMERRSFATFRRLCPEKYFIVSSPPISYKNYPNEIIPKDLFINIMVGDLQRIKLYGETGFQIPQEIPEKVWQAYEKLVELGYNKHLVKIKI